LSVIEVRRLSMRSYFVLALTFSALSAIVTPCLAKEAAKPTGSFDGIGVQLNPRRTSDGYFTIANVVPGASKTVRLSLKRGDRIVAVDGASVQGKSLRDVIDRISGPAGTSVRVKVRRSGVAAPIKADITRTSIPYSTQ
jgi:carboxyl-terminal processing protease